MRGIEGPPVQLIEDCTPVRPIILASLLVLIPVELKIRVEIDRIRLCRKKKEKMPSFETVPLPIGYIFIYVYCAIKWGSCYKDTTYKERKHKRVEAWYVKYVKIGICVIMNIMV